MTKVLVGQTALAKKAARSKIKEHKGKVKNLPQKDKDELLEALMELLDD